MNGSFTANTLMGTATVLVFLDTNNKYIGQKLIRFLYFLLDYFQKILLKAKS